MQWLSCSVVFSVGEEFRRRREWQVVVAEMSSAVAERLKEIGSFILIVVVVMDKA